MIVGGRAEHNPEILRITTESECPGCCDIDLFTKASFTRRTDSNRYSLASTSDVNHPSIGNNTFDVSTMDSTAFSGAPRQRHDSNTLLMLPAPLAVNRHPMSSASSVGMSRSSEDNNYSSDTASASNQRLVPSPQSISVDQYSDTYESPVPTGSRYESPVPRAAPGVRNSSLPPLPSQDSGSNPFNNRDYVTSPVSYEEPIYSPESEDSGPVGRSSRAGGRGVSLTDSGPVPGPDGVRRVARPSGRRPSSQAPPQNRYSRNSTAFSLPPGAAPPQPNYGSHN